MKKQLLFLVMMLLPLVASAEVVEINGIYYEIFTKFKEAHVMCNPNYTGSYTGNIVIPETVNYKNVSCKVKTIYDNAFHNCSSLTSVTIPESVTSIGEYAFSKCSSLSSVTIPNSITFIENYAFQDCSDLISIAIPNSVTFIGSYAFKY